ncbi:hypothetical protein [Streptomyces sp. NPDC055058]
MIDNTSESMKDPANALLMVAASTGPGGAGQAIAEQERAGQAQLVHSEQLPTGLDGDDEAAFEALGFIFGEPTPGDPLFRQATLPEGWRKVPSDHDMWSHVTDQLGRRRASIFYKAAFYDRRAFMRLNTLHAYVSECLYQDTPIVTDDTWATPAAVAQALRDLAARAQDNVDEWQDIAQRHGETDDTRKYVAEFTAARDKYTALAGGFEAVTQA